MNFGDEITPLALALASGRRVRWAPPAVAEVIAVGSILDLYADSHGTGGAIVWGAGLRWHPKSAERAEFIRSRLGPVLAVRGPLTRQALALPPDTSVADPGVLAAHLIRKAPRRRGTGFLPHFRTWATAEGRNAVGRSKAAGHRVIVPSDTATHVLKRIASLDFLYTSSLHGLICAHALGTPAQWVNIPGVPEWDEPSFKFRDYLTSVGSTMEVLALDGRVASMPEATQVRRDEAPRLREVSDQLGTQLIERWV